MAGPGAVGPIEPLELVLFAFTHLELPDDRDHEYLLIMRCDCIAPHRSSASTLRRATCKGWRCACTAGLSLSLRRRRDDSAPPRPIPCGAPRDFRRLHCRDVLSSRHAGGRCRPKASDGRGHDFGAAADTGQRRAGRRSHRDGHQQRRWDAPPGDHQQHWRVHDQSAAGPIPDRSRAAVRGSREWRSYRPAGWRERHRLPAGDHGRAA